jgi:hypothetical protein
MQRIDSFGAVAAPPTPEAQVNPPGFFSIGNPSLAIPATIVAAWWLNALQEELANVIESAGLTLDKGDDSQLLQAITGLAQNSTNQFVLANNQVGAANITGMIFDKTIYKSAEIEFDLYRKDAVKEVSVMGRMYAIFKPVANTWEIFGPTIDGDLTNDHGVVFTIDAATGQVQYTSDNFAGGSYVGLLRFRMKRFKLN